MIIYKDVLSKLKDAGYSTTVLRREKLLPESILDRLRHNKAITTDTLDVICRLTSLPVSELIEYVDNIDESNS